MDLFRRRRDNRRNKPRPVGRLAAFWYGVVNVVFYCILSDAAVNNDGTQIIANEPPAVSSISMAAKSTKKKVDTNINTNSQVHYRRTNHDPNDSNSLSKPSLPYAHSPSSVGGLGEEKRNEQGKKTASLKRSSFSWFRKGSKTSNVKEEGCDIDTSQPAYPAATSATKEQNSQSDSSFKILKLLASPGGARKGIPSFNQELFPSVHSTTQYSILSLGSIEVSVLSDSQTSTSASHVVPHLIDDLDTTLDTTTKTGDCNTTTVSDTKLLVLGALETSDVPAHCAAPVCPDMSAGDEISVDSSVPVNNEIAVEDDFKNAAQMPEDKRSPFSDAIPAETDGFQDGAEMLEDTDSTPFSNEIPTDSDIHTAPEATVDLGNSDTTPRDDA